MTDYMAEKIAALAANPKRYPQMPWRVDLQTECPNARVVGADGRVIAVVLQRDPHPAQGQGVTAEQAQAVAALIAQAPELLRLVEISIGNIKSLGPAGALGDLPHEPYRVWLAQLEDVRAKALAVVEKPAPLATPEPQSLVDALERAGQRRLIA